MPSPAELLGGLASFVGEILGASSLRFEIGPTLVVLGVVLVLLQLVAGRSAAGSRRTPPAWPASAGRWRWLPSRAPMRWCRSVAPESHARQTRSAACRRVAALPILGHVGPRRGAQRHPVARAHERPDCGGDGGHPRSMPAHASTATQERQGRSRIVMVGEGRPTIAGLAMTTRARPAAAFALGSLREEGLLHLDGLRAGAGSLATVSAEAAQAPSLLLGGGASPHRPGAIPGGRRPAFGRGGAHDGAGGQPAHRPGGAPSSCSGRSSPWPESSTSANSSRGLARG